MFFYFFIFEQYNANGWVEDLVHSWEDFWEGFEKCIKIATKEGHHGGTIQVAVIKKNKLKVISEFLTSRADSGKYYVQEVKGKYLKLAKKYNKTK